MPIISDKAVTDLKDAVQAEATIVSSVVTFIGGIPKMIRDAVAAAQSNGTDVSDAVEQVVQSIQSQSNSLSTALLTNADGDPAPIGNLPAPSVDNTASDDSADTSGT